MTLSKKNNGRLSKAQMEQKKTQVIQILANTAEPTSIGDIWKQIDSDPTTTIRSLVRDNLVVMVGGVSGKAKKQSRFLYKLTHAGLVVASKDAKALERVTAQRRMHSHLIGDYSPLDFQVPYRPGSFDYEKIPSLVQGVKLPYSPPKSILTGKTEAYATPSSIDQISKETAYD